MGRPHLIAALIIVLSTSLLLPGHDEPGHYIQTAIPQAGGNAAGSNNLDADAPLLIRKR